MRNKTIPEPCGICGNLVCRHREVTEAGKRMSEIVTDYCVNQPHDVLAHCWIAVRLEDGSTDGALYDTRKDAIRHQRFPKECFYFSFREAMSGISARDASMLLELYRVQFLRGRYFVDADYAGMAPITPLTREDMLRAIRAAEADREYISIPYLTLPQS